MMNIKTLVFFLAIMTVLITYCSARNDLQRLLNGKRGFVKPTAICSCYSVNSDPRGHDGYGCYGDQAYDSLAGYDGYGGGYRTISCYFDAGNPGSGAASCNEQCDKNCNCAKNNCDFSTCLT